MALGDVGGFDLEQLMGGLHDLTGGSGGVGAFAGPLTGDPMVGENTWGADQSWWDRFGSKDNMETLAKAAATLKPMADPMAASARLPPPGASYHPGSEPAMLGQYVDLLRQRQQQLRQQFMPKVSGLLGG